MATFTVDTHLFRELGDLLVGRDSTALVELIKNSYDADATSVVVYGENLRTPSKGLIRISDNGIGMSREEFESGFLRIAARTKDTHNRRSRLFQRRYTGAKGIGRLAAHKLATFLEVESSRWNGDRRQVQSKKLPAEATNLDASIDWNLIEEQETLDEVESTAAITVGSTSARGKTSAGTTITLRRLRRGWTTRDHARFLEEMDAFQVPAALVNALPKSVCSELLFDRPKVRDIASSLGHEFDVRLEGELASQDEFWVAVIGAASWIIEIDASPATKTVRYAIAPTRTTRIELTDAVERVFEVPHPSPQHGPFFQARILKRSGVQQGDSAIKQWSGRSSGIRVFVEGFRVLPYGEPRNDWLSLDRDYAQRDRALNRHLLEGLEAQLRDKENDPNIGLQHVSNKHYAGGIFILEKDAPSLRMLVNREGFIPDDGYQTLVDLVRRGIDLCTRVQAAATHERRAERAQFRSEKKVVSTSDEVMPSAGAFRAALADAKRHAQQSRQLVAAGRSDEAKEELLRSMTEIDKAVAVTDEFAEEAAMIRVLSSVGLQLAAFVHELNGILGIANAVDKALEGLRNSSGLSAAHKRDLALLHRSVGDLKRALDRQASYLVDVATPDARRRRSRQPLAKRFDSALALVSSAAQRQGIQISNKIAPELKSTPMFAAEMTAVFTNLLTNAVKAAGPRGRVVCTAKLGRDGRVLVRLENTGTRVSLRHAERWFKPFESSTTEVDSVLGQGMGLGLPITRSILEEYGAEVAFVEPGSNFSTAVEIRFAE